MQFGLRISGHIYKLDQNEDCLYFDIDKFMEEFIAFVGAKNMYFGGVFTRVDLSEEDE